MVDKQFVFIGGLHRSGTSVLHRILSEAPEISGFQNTSVPENEGQHLQQVFPTAKSLGGPGAFALHPSAHLTESSPLNTPISKANLLAAWQPHWDNTKRIYIEKSPPNLIRRRFLQALFPNALFITIIRHPLAVSLATQKWSTKTLPQLIQHWLTAHRIYRSDSSAVNQQATLSYEQLCRHPSTCLELLEKLLQTELPLNEELHNYNQQYFDYWHKIPWWRIDRSVTQQRCLNSFESDVREFGYSLKDLTAFPKHPN